MNNKNTVVGHFDGAAKKYRANYEGNNIVSHSFNTRLRIVLSIIGDVNGKGILDIGCGPGILAGCLVKNKCEFTGIDISGEMIQECLKDGELKGFSFKADDPILFFEKNPEKKFHVIVCMGLFEYLTDEYSRRLMGQISGHLYPDGVFIATYPNIYSPYRLADRLYRKLTRKETMVPPYTPGVSHKEFSESGLRREWAMHNIEINKTVYYNFRLMPKPLDAWLKTLDLFVSRWLQILSESRFRFLATGMVLRGSKKTGNDAR